ncbi:MAG: hypothetical protein B7733_12410 [Myxococcales bacterium FL481]|nr:MAG: hypothetical protein B7733_12410 [Myxococcales bacterium FL481]
MGRAGGLGWSPGVGVQRGLGHCVVVSLPSWLDAGLDDLELNLTAVQRDRLARLLELWARYRGVLNLVGAAVEDQVLEGLLTCRALRDAGAEDVDWTDVGSGGGFPGLLLAAVLRGRGQLVEPRARRAAFLWTALAGIGRADCRVFRARLGEGGWSGASGESVPVRTAAVTARAVFDPARWVRLAAQCVGSGGYVVVHLPAGASAVSECETIAARTYSRWRVDVLRCEVE